MKNVSEANKQVCKFTFLDGTKRDWIESHLSWAIFNAECTFGKSKVRIEASYFIADDKPECVVDVSTKVGEHIAQLLTGIMIRELGEEGFAVERLQNRQTIYPPGCNFLAPKATNL